MKRVNYDQSLLDDRLMDLSFPGQRTTTATSCVPHDSVYTPGARGGSLILDSNYSKMTLKFVKYESHWLHSSIKFADPGTLNSS